MRVNIEYLADRPECVDMIAGWLFDEFHGLIPGKTRDDVVLSLGSRMNRDRLPLAVVAETGGAIVGTASLKTDDLEERPDLSPWLAGLYVAKGHRGRGIGGRLVRSVLDIARGIGFGEVFLYTPGASRFYGRIGWETVAGLEYRSHEITLMRYALRAPEKK